MTISFDLADVTGNGKYTYDITKDGEQVGSIEYRVDQETCYVIDFDLHKGEKVHKTILDCVNDLGEEYRERYTQLGEKVTIHNGLFPW